jgi:hypothetical protein
MKFLKGLALGLLGLLLFLSLAVFSLAFAINQTVLNPDFVAAQVHKLDISSLAEEVISGQLPQLGQGMDAVMGEAINNTIADLEPWIKEQADDAIHSAYDYFLGKSQSLSIVISTAELKTALKENLKSAFLKSPPPEFAAVPPEMINTYFDQYYEQMAAQIPATIDIGRELLDQKTMATLEQARQYISYFQTGYKAIIALILVLIAGICLIHRQVRGATRQLGTTFLVYAVPEYVGIIIGKHYAGAQIAQLMAQPSFPASLQSWLPQVVNEIIKPLEMFSLGALICGAVLLVVSFVYKPQEH